MAKTREHDAQDVAEVQENDGGRQYGMQPKALNSGQEHSDTEQQKLVQSARGDSGVAN